LIWSPDEELRYVDAVVREMTIYHHRFGMIPLRSIFWGGGTPSVLTESAISAIAEAIHRYFKVPPGIEWTIEANPETLTAMRLARFVDAGVNRVSVGIQSARPSELALLGRAHTYSSMVPCLDLIRDAGIDNINLDLIYGLPGQTLDAVSESIEWVLSQGPTHLSTYALSIEPGTVYAKTGVSPVDDLLQLRMYREIRRRARLDGFRQYEVSAFGRPGYESVHNLTYWHYAPYIGLGPSASSFFNGMAYQQVSSLDRYVADPTPPVIRVPLALDSDTLATHFLIANLRRSEGLTYSKIRRELGRDHWGASAVSVVEMKRLGLLRRRNDRLQLTRRGVELMNSVLEGLL